MSHVSAGETPHAALHSPERLSGRGGHKNDNSMMLTEKRQKREWRSKRENESMTRNGGTSEFNETK